MPSLVKNLELSLKESTCLNIKNVRVWVGSGQYGINWEEVVNNRLRSLCKVHHRHALHLITTSCLVFVLLVQVIRDSRNKLDLPTNVLKKKASGFFYIQHSSRLLSAMLDNNFNLKDAAGRLEKMELRGRIHNVPLMSRRSFV